MPNRSANHSVATFGILMRTVAGLLEIGAIKLPCLSQKAGSRHVSEISPLKSNGKYIYHLLYSQQTCFCIYGFHMILCASNDYFLNNINHLIFVMMKCGVIFEVRTEFLNNI
jgi:hypothetical protein